MQLGGRNIPTLNSQSFMWSVFVDTVTSLITHYEGSPLTSEYNLRVSHIHAPAGIVHTGAEIRNLDSDEVVQMKDIEQSLTISLELFFIVCTVLRG